MAGILMGWVYYYDFSKPQRDVLLALADHGKEDGTHIHPSIETMMWKLESDRRHIQRTLRELEKMEVLIPVAYATGGRGHATEYEMHLEAAPLKAAPPPGERMKRIWEMLKGGLYTTLSDDETLEKGGSYSALSRQNSGASTALSTKDAKGRTFTHTKGGLSRTKGGLSRTKGGVQTAPTNITISNNHQENHARTRETPLAEKNLGEADSEPEADPPLVPRRPPYSDPAFRRWALSQTGGWANLSGKRLGLMMDQYCDAKGIPL